MYYLCLPILKYTDINGMNEWMNHDDDDDDDSLWSTAESDMNMGIYLANPTHYVVYVDPVRPIFVCPKVSHWVVLTLRALAAQCIVIDPVCLCVCVCVCLFVGLLPR